MSTATPTHADTALLADRYESALTNYQDARPHANNGVTMALAAPLDRRKAELLAALGPGLFTHNGIHYCRDINGHLRRMLASVEPETRPASLCQTFRVLRLRWLIGRYEASRAREAKPGRKPEVLAKTLRLRWAVEDALASDPACVERRGIVYRLDIHGILVRIPLAGKAVLS